MGYKAGMTHILREVEKPGSKIHKKEATEVGVLAGEIAFSECLLTSGHSITAALVYSLLKTAPFAYFGELGWKLERHECWAGVSVPLERHAWMILKHVLASCGFGILPFRT